MSIRAALAGLRIHEVPSHERPRLHGSSNLSAITDGLRILRLILREKQVSMRRAARKPKPFMAPGRLATDGQLSLSAGDQRGPAAGTTLGSSPVAGRAHPAVAQPGRAALGALGYQVQANRSRARASTRPTGRSGASPSRSAHALASRNLGSRTQAARVRSGNRDGSGGTRAVNQ
jgi:hypothetical protein